jgi:hypothetical protein
MSSRSTSSGYILNIDFIITSYLSYIRVAHYRLKFNNSKPVIYTLPKKRAKKNIKLSKKQKALNIPKKSSKKGLSLLESARLLRIFNKMSMSKHSFKFMFNYVFLPPLLPEYDNQDKKDGEWPLERTLHRFALETLESFI